VSKTLYVTCAFCRGVMEVKADSGEVVQKWEAQPEEDIQDKMSSALKKINEGKKRRENLFDAKKHEIEGQKKQAEDLFRQEVEKAKKEGVRENPLKPFDLD
jgi:hypothetical protein